VRYSCTRCEIDLVDVLDGSAATAAQQAAFYASLSSDVIFAPPGELGAAALEAAATSGAAVIGAETDVYTSVFAEGATTGADKVLSSLLFSPAQAVAAALAAYRAGEPLNGNLRLEAASGALALAPYRDTDGLLSALDRTEIAAVLQRLASGELDTGVDPATGEER
jgi:basic membrane lipoprotein Med (substrate-binding protein (PBP1-ABC) superfamily)